MAAPNIVNVSTITAKSLGQAITTSATAIVTNSAGSGKVFKINSLIIANVNGTSPADITARVFKAAASTSYNLAFTISVPNDATLVLISKDTSVYLEEGDYIDLLASSNLYLQGIVSYEEIS